MADTSTPTHLNLTIKQPRQKISQKKKDKVWHEENVEAIIGMSFFGKNAWHNPRRWMHKAYNYYAGRIEDSDYKHLLEPYGKKRRNMPAKLKNFNILKPNIDLLLGEKAKRPPKHVVTVSNDDVVTRKSEARKNFAFQQLYLEFMNELRRTDMGDGQSPEQLPTFQQAMEDFEDTYIDMRANIGQMSVNYINWHQEIPRKFRTGFFHFLISGSVVSEKKIIGEDTVENILNPLQVDYDKSPDAPFIEDGDWASHRKYCHVSAVIDEFSDYLTEEQIDQLEERRVETGASYNETFITDIDYKLERTEDDHQNRGRTIEVIYCTWKSLKKTGIVSHIMPDGEIFEEEVDENYKAAEGETVDWFWETESRQGTRIDGNIYVQLEALPIQRNFMGKRSGCKLSINGRRYSDINTPAISLIMLGVPFQLLYNIYHWRLEIAVAKSRDVIAQLDVSMLPEDWEMDEFMYWMDAVGIAWTQSKKEGETFTGSPTHRGMIDLSIKNMREYGELLMMVKAQWDELSGVTKERRGQTSPYQLKGVLEQSIIQSSHITEDFFQKFTEFEERELEGLLDLSRYSWINGMKREFLMPDYTRAILEVDGIQHMETEYGVHVKDSGEEREKVSLMQGLVQQLAQQQGMPMAMIAQIVDASSFNQIEDKIRDIDKTAARIREQEAQLQQQQVEAGQQAAQQAQAFEAQENEADRQKDITVAQIKAEAQLQASQMGNTDSDGDGQSDMYEAFDRVEETEIQVRAAKEKQDKELALKREIHEDDLTLATRAQKHKEKVDVAKLAIDRKKATQRPKSTS